MLYSLSIPSVRRSIHAAAAIEVLSDPDAKSRLAPLLGPGRDEVTDVLIRDAFASLLLGLLPHIEDAVLDDETLLKVSLRTPADLPAGVHGSVCRALETYLAGTVMAAVDPSRPAPGVPDLESLLLWRPMVRTPWP